MAIPFVATLVLALLVGGIVLAAITGGPLYNTLMEGSNKNKELLKSISGTITIDGETEQERQETLADAAMYVYDRAWGCEKVIDQLDYAKDNSNSRDSAYPGMEGTVYSANPDCVGKEANVLARPEDLWGDPGNDMEGKFGKINFEVKKPFTMELKTRYSAESKAFSSVDENDLYFQVNGVATETGYYEKAKNEKGNVNVEIHYGRYNFPVFFKKDGSSRVDKTGSDAYTLEELLVSSETFEVQRGPSNFQEYTISDTAGWYLPALDSVSYSVSPLRVSGSDRATINGQGSISVQFCPGDEGYIQANKGKPAFQGDAASKTVYPFIQLTKLGESCGS